MRAPFIGLLLAAVALLPAGRAAAQTVPAQASVSATARPASGTAATIAGGDTTVVAWAQQTAAGQRVLASTGAELASAGAVPASGATAPDFVVLGPGGPGHDGAPASTAPGDGSVWILASRNDGAGQRLWMQRWAGGAWQAASAGPTARPWDHHPALAADPASRQVWATWIGEDGVDGNASRLYASRWSGRGWTPAEPLPRSVGVPMAPSIAVDTSGTPHVAWAAGDGTDAEIWVSARRGGRWSSPVPLSRNDVPDINPSIAVTESGVLVTWASYTAAGYLPLVLTGDGTDYGGTPVVIDSSPGGRPRALSIDGRPAVFWRRLTTQPAGGTITSRVLEADGWSQPASVASTSGSPFSVASGPGGRLMLAFSQPDGQLGVAETAPGGRRDELEALVAASTARFGAPLASTTTDFPAPVAAAEGEPVIIIPENYTAFGDSITNGVVYDPDRRTSPGYRDLLQRLLRDFFGRATVFNAGVDGETTADGLGRIDNAVVSQQPGVILIMEGTNDIVNAIDVDTIAFNLRGMVQRVYQEKPDTLPFLAQLPPRLDPGPEGFDGPGNGRIDQLNAMLPTIGMEEGAGVVDMNTPIDGHPELMSNPLHPSVAGYERMAEVWYDAVRPAVAGLTNSGDIDASGRTDGLDLVHLALAFGARVGEQRYTLEADINGDGVIDGFDLDLLIEFFGQNVSSSGGGGG